MSTILPFSRKSDRKREKRALLFTYEQKIICSETQLEDIALEQTIICRQVFAGHVVGSRAIKKKKNLHRIDNSSYYKFIVCPIGRVISREVISLHNH